MPFPRKDLIYLCTNRINNLLYAHRLGNGIHAAICTNSCMFAWRASLPTNPATYVQAVEARLRSIAGEKETMPWIRTLQDACVIAHTHTQTRNINTRSLTQNYYFHCHAPGRDRTLHCTLIKTTSTGSRDTVEIFIFAKLHRLVRASFLLY